MYVHLLTQVFDVHLHVHVYITHITAMVALALHVVFTPWCACA